MTAKIREAPMKRITSPTKAHSYVQALVNEDGTRAAKRNIVSGMVAGNAPFNAKKLKATGQAHRTNVNFREGEGIIQARNTSFFNLFLEGRNIIEARLIDGNQYMGRARFWESIVMDEIGQLINVHWKGFIFEMMRLANSLNMHGTAFPLWEAEGEWKWKTFITGEVLFPKNTKASVEYIRSCAIMGEFSIPDLLEKISSDKADEMGWQVANCQGVIKRILKKRLNQLNDSWEQLQLDIENDALSYESGLVGTVKVAHILAREDSGKYSHYIVERGRTNDGFLYKNEDAYEKIESAFIPFIAGIGNGYFHGIKGIGHRVYPSVVINNRLLCRTIDGAMDAQSLILSFKDGQKRGKTLRLGNTIMLPSGGQLQQHHIEQNLQAATGVYSLLTQVNQSSIGAKRPGLSAVAKDTVAKTRAADTRDAIEEVQLEATDIALYYTQADMLYEQMCIRIFASQSAEAKEFRDRCKKRGVPEKLLSESERWRFTAPRTIGSGSKVIRHITTQEMLSVAPYLPEAGKRNVIEDFIESRGGPAAVNRYYPPFEDDTMPTRSHQHAQMENSFMIKGDAMIVSIDDWHPTHLDAHFAFVEEYVGKVLQGDPQDELPQIMQAVNMFLDHIGNHMAYLKNDDLHASQLGQYHSRLKELIKHIRGIEQAYRAWVVEMKKREAEQQKQLEELQARGDQAEVMKKMMEIQADVQFRKYKEDHNHEARMIKAVHGMQLAEAETAAYIDRENRKAEAAKGA